MARLNVIWVYADDQPWDSYQHMAYLGEHPDAVHFPRSVNVCPICGPSRLVSVCAQQARRAGYADNNTIDDDVYGGFNEQQAIGATMQRAGYHTMFCGKEINGWPWEPTTADDCYVVDGWDQYCTITPNNYYHAIEYREDGVQGSRLNAHTYRNHAQWDKALAWLTARPAGPFYLALPLYSPHTDSSGNIHPWDGKGAADVPMARHGVIEDDSIVDITLVDAPSFNEADISDKPAWLSAAHPNVLTTEEVDEIRSLHVDALRTMLSIDREMEYLLDTFLPAQGLDGNTVVIYSTDNANLFGEHRHDLGKGVPYMEALGLGAKVWWPGVAGRVDDALVTNMDIPATIVDIARGQWANTPDGMSFAARVQDEDVAFRDAVYIEFDKGPADQYDTPTWTAVYNGEWIYTEYDGGDLELYDLTADPGQLTNLAGTGLEIELTLADALARLAAQQVTELT